MLLAAINCCIQNSVVACLHKCITGLTASISTCLYLSRALWVCGMWLIADSSFKGNNKHHVALKRRCRLPEIAQSSTSVCFRNPALCQTSSLCFNNLIVLFVMRWLLRDLYSLVCRCFSHKYAMQTIHLCHENQ